MKTGRNLIELATEVHRQSGAARDLIADTRSMALSENNLVVGVGSDQEAFEATEHTHRQIATWSGIPVKYYETMRAEAPTLLENNVNHWLSEKPARRMVRTLDLKARAFLSDRYFRLDNEAVMESFLPHLMEREREMVLLSSEVTARKLYMKVLFPQVAFEVKADDVVRAGLVLTNSEIGQGSVNVSRFFYRDFCTNGCVFGTRDLGAFKRTHLGRRLDADDVDVYRQETIAAEQRAALLKIGDVVAAAADPRLFEDSVVKVLREATGGPKIADPIAAVEELRKEVGFTQDEGKSVLQNLIAGGDYSRWGALNALTALANDRKSYDRASELEALGSRVLELSPAQWRRIAEAV